MKHKLKFIAVSILVMAAVFLAGCKGFGGPSGDAQIVYFSYYSDSDRNVLKEMEDLIDEFNSGYGKENDIYVEGAGVSSIGDQNVVLSTQLTSSTGADVVTLPDEWFKPHAKNLEPLDGDVGTESIYENLYSRVVYNSDSGLHDENAKLLAVPVYNNPAVLYVNLSVLQSVGVVYISVEEDDLDSFNAGGKDENGKTKSDLGLSDVTVLKKGFQRDTPYVYGVNKWQSPAADETMIFNDKIAMNWDETDDLARICMNSFNGGKGADYGFGTQWWNSYVWSVGGDCLLKTNNYQDGGVGYNYGLAEDYSNYIVLSDQGYQGEFTGRHYAKGETLELLDKLEVQKGEEITPDSDGSFRVNGQKAKIRNSVSAAAREGTLAQLPSTKTAMTRYALLSAAGSEKVSPDYATVKDNGITYFTNDRMAMIVERVSKLATVNSKMEIGDYTVTYTPVYKEYVSPADASCDEVKTQGKYATHSHMTSVGIRKGSEVKKEALVFVKWLAGSAQKKLAEDGFGCVNAEYESLMLSVTDWTKNTAIINEANKISGKGDWAYLKSRSWIDNWATFLNSGVASGNKTIEEFFGANVTDQANADIKKAFV